MVSPSILANPSTSRRGRALQLGLVITTALATIWQIARSMQEPEFGAHRLFALCGAGLVLLVTLAPRFRPSRWAATRGLAAACAAAIVWVSVLDWLLADGPVLAAGVLGLLAAWGVHTLIAMVMIRRLTGSPKSVLTLRLGLLLVTLAIGAWGLELILGSVFPRNIYRVVPDDPSMGELWYTKDGTYRARSDFKGRYMHPEFPGCRIETNAWGLRDDPEDARPRSDEESVVLVLGDSFAFGTGVAMTETFHDRCEQRAAELSTGPVRFVCAAFPGHGPIDMIRMLREYSERLRPDVVIAAFCEANDFENTLTEEGRLRKEKAAGTSTLDVTLPEVAAALQEDPEADLLKFNRGKSLNLHSRPTLETDGRAQASQTPKSERLTVERFGAALLTYRYWGGSSTIVQVSQHWFEGLFVSLGWIKPHGINWNAFLRESFRVDLPDFVARGAERTANHLRILRDECRKSGAKPVVLLVPAATQADPVRFQELVDHYMAAADRQRCDRLQFHSRFAAYLRSEFDDVVDPLTELEAAIGQGKACYFREGHWTREGHAIAAAALLPVLARALAR